MLTPIDRMQSRVCNRHHDRPASKISGGTVYDPANGIDGQVRDLWIADGKIVAAPTDPASGPRATIDARGLVVMPGGVDMHCHIAGPKVNVARKMRPEEKRKARSAAPHGQSRTAARWAASPARSPPATSTPAWATRPPSTPPFRRSAPATPTKNSRTRPASTRAFTS